MKNDLKTNLGPALGAEYDKMLFRPLPDLWLELLRQMDDAAAHFRVKHEVGSPRPSVAS